MIYSSRNMKIKSKKVILWALALTCCGFGLRAEDNRTQDPTKCLLEMHSVERMLDHVIIKKQLALVVYECNASEAFFDVFTRGNISARFLGDGLFMQIVGRMRFVESLKGKPMSTVKVNELVEQPDRRGDPQERYLGLRPLTDYFEDGRPSLYVVAGDDPKDILKHSFFGPLDQDPKEIAKVLKQVVALDGKPDAEWVTAARELQGSRSLFAALTGLVVLNKKNTLKMTDFLSLHDDIYKSSCGPVLGAAFSEVDFAADALREEIADELMAVFTDKDFPLEKKTLMAWAVASLAQYNSKGTRTTLRKNKVFQSQLLALIKKADGVGSSPALIAAYKKLLSYLSPPDPQKISED
jgi:hypothetical protein